MKEALEQRKKEVDSQLKADIEAQNSCIGRLSRLIVTGFEMRMVDIRIELDTPESGKKRIVRLDTGEEVAVKPMSDSDRQMVIDLREKAEASEAAAEAAKEPIVTPPPYQQRIEAPESNGHKYPGITDKGFEFTSDCEYGCGCWMGGSRSGGPDGVDPFGVCPKATVDVSRTKVVNEALHKAVDMAATLSTAVGMGGTHQAKRNRKRNAEAESFADGSVGE